jgi:predicted ATPase/DNA-binding winged helix-turn-helix (wHTH) protein
MVMPFSFLFGPFAVHFPQRALTKDGQTVRIGSRAIDILVVLLEHAGTLVSTRHLCDRVWADQVVDEGALRVHLSALRKALGEGPDGLRYIVNETGRGYRLTVPVIRSSGASPSAAPQPIKTRSPFARALPMTLARVIGRDEIVQGLCAQLAERRLLTITGPGGMGKTTVAVAIANRFATDTNAQPYFVNFAPVSDPAHAASTVASVVGAAVSNADPIPDLLSQLGDAPVLLVLDNCEHLIDAVAELAERLLHGSTAIQLLVTSREPLRADGESVHRLAALPSPAPGMRIDLETAANYPAIALFRDRACAANDAFSLTEASVDAVCDICRRLDGIPLAIEFAAARVGSMDVHAIAARLDDRFALLTQGRRTALPRQQTLRATLDWSYELLQPQEQAVLRRLSVLRTAFDMAAVAAVAGDPTVDARAAFDATNGLVSKSLIAWNADDVAAPYRLLDTLRHYAHLRLEEADEGVATRQRHAAYCCAVFADPDAAWEGKAPREWLALHSRRIDDIRAAFEWATGPQGDTQRAIDLVVVTAPLWFHLSLPHEFLGMAKQALTIVERTALAGTAQHIALLGAYGHALWHTHGPAEEMADAFDKAYDAAERLDDLDMVLRSLWGVWAHRILSGSYAESASLAERFTTLAEPIGELSLRQTADHMLALSHHFLGNHDIAHALIEGVIARDDTPIRANHANHAQVDGEIAAISLLMRILWLKGETDRALTMARHCATVALTIDHDLSICYGLAIGSIPVAIWAQERDMARTLTDQLRMRTRQRGLAHWDKWATGFDALIDGKAISTSDATVMQLEFFASAGATSCKAALLEMRRAQAPSWFRDRLGT